MLSGKVQAASSGSSDALAVGHASAPYVSVYEWTGNGLGSKFANPASAMTFAGTTVSFSPDGSALAVGGTGFSVYEWRNTGFGSKYTVPFNATASKDAVFSRDGLTLVCDGRAYGWSSSGFGTDYGVVSGTYTGDVVNANVMNATSTVYAYSETSRGVTIYGFRAWTSGVGWGSNYSLPSGGNAFLSIPRPIGFSPDNSVVAMAGPLTLTPFAYPWSDATGFGTRYANPATSPTGVATFCTFAPDNDALAFSHASSPFLTVYAWSGSGFGTKYANPATLPPASGSGTSVAFNGAGTAIAVTGDASPYVSVYPWSSSGFGTKYADPATLPTGAANSAVFISSKT